MVGLRSKVAVLIENSIPTVLRKPRVNTATRLTDGCRKEGAIFHRGRYRVWNVIVVMIMLQSSPANIFYSILTQFNNLARSFPVFSFAENELEAGMRRRDPVTIPRSTACPWGYTRWSEMGKVGERTRGETLSPFNEALKWLGCKSANDFLDTTGKLSLAQLSEEWV